MFLKNYQFAVLGIALCLGCTNAALALTLTQAPGQNLNYGTFTSPTVGTTISYSPVTNVRTVLSGTPGIPILNTHQRATFNIAGGNGGQQVRVSFLGGVATLTGPGPSLTAQGFQSNPSAGTPITLLAGGTASFTVAGALSIPINAVSGNYIGNSLNQVRITDLGGIVLATANLSEIRAQIYSRINFTGTQTMNFGRIVRGTTNSTAAIDYLGNIVVTGDAQSLDTPPTTTPGQITATGESSATVSISATPSVNLSNGSDTLTVDGIQAVNVGTGGTPPTSFDVGGVYTAAIIGTAHISNTQDPGVYTGNVTVTLNYT